MTKKDDEGLATFRIADVKRAEVRSFKKPQDSTESAAPSGPSVGFPAIEQRLERGTIEDLAEELRPAYEKLEALAQKGEMRGRTNAKKAMAAYERTADLFEYLFETKAALQGPGSKS